MAIWIGQCWPLQYEVTTVSIPSLTWGSSLPLFYAEWGCDGHVRDTLPGSGSYPRDAAWERLLRHRHCVRGPFGDLRGRRDAVGGAAVPGGPPAFQAAAEPWRDRRHGSAGAGPQHRRSALRVAVRQLRL